MAEPLPRDQVEPQGAPAARPAIGILGGMGPEATVDLMRRVIAATPAEDDQDHVHLVVDNNPQVPSRIKSLIEGTGPSPAPVLCDMARRLERFGVIALAMPCNSAHAYLTEIRGATSLPVLDMIGMTAERLAEPGLPGSRIGVLASTAVHLTGLYERALAAQGLEPLVPASQERVMELVRAVKRGATGLPERAGLAEIGAELKGQGADILLVACTELSVIADALGPDLPRLDSLDVLAEAIVETARAAERPAARKATGGD